MDGDSFSMLRLREVPLPLPLLRRPPLVLSEGGRWRGGSRASGDRARPRDPDRECPGSLDGLLTGLGGPLPPGDRDATEEPDVSGEPETLLLPPPPPP